MQTWKKVHPYDQGSCKFFGNSGEMQVKFYAVFGEIMSYIAILLFLGQSGQFLENFGNLIAFV